MRRLPLSLPLLLPLPPMSRLLQQQMQLKQLPQQQLQQMQQQQLLQQKTQLQRRRTATTSIKIELSSPTSSFARAR